MSKIVFFCIPAHGHTNPTLGVVRELIERGHEVLSVHGLLQELAWYVHVPVYKKIRFYS